MCWCYFSRDDEGRGTKQEAPIKFVPGEMCRQLCVVNSSLTNWPRRARGKIGKTAVCQFGLCLLHNPLCLHSIASRTKRAESTISSKKYVSPDTLFAYKTDICQSGLRTQLESSSCVRVRTSAWSKAWPIRVLDPDYLPVPLRVFRKYK